MKHILPIIIVSLISIGVSAQNRENSKMSKKLFFSYGQTYNLKLDNTYSRLAKNGFTHTLNFGFENVKSSRIIETQGGLIFGSLKTKGNNINIINDFAGNLKLRYLTKINQLNKNNLQVYVGGIFNFRGDIWFPRNSDLRYGWDINLGTGISTLLQYKINPKLIFQYHFDLPVIGVLWRSHNNGQQLVTEETQLEKGIIASAFGTPRFSNLFNTLYIGNSFKLHYSISKRVTLFYNLTISYIFIKKPLAKKGYEFSNAIGIAYKF
jgi:hypothetical protein